MSESNATLTTEEAAVALGVTPSRVRQMIRAGQLLASRFGRSHVIYAKDLALVEERPIGRPRKSAPTPEKRATGAARARHGTSAGKKKGGKK